MRVAVVTLAVLAAAAVVGFGLPGHGGSHPVVKAGGADAFTAGTVTQPAFAIDSSGPLSRATATWAPVLRGAAVRTSPASGASVITRLAARTYDRTTQIVQILGRARRGHQLWLRVRYPSRSANARGWMPRSAVGGYTSVGTRLVIDRRSLTLTLLRAGRAVFRAPVGIGKPGTPTPAGSFYIADRLTRFADPFYGPIAFGTSARSAVLTDWPGGGQIGIHGTNQPGLIPGRISHGCIRLRNSDIVKLARELPIGTPVIVR